MYSGGKGIQRKITYNNQSSQITNLVEVQSPKDLLHWLIPPLMLVFFSPFHFAQSASDSLQWLLWLLVNVQSQHACNG